MSLCIRIALAATLTAVPWVVCALPQPGSGQAAPRVERKTCRAVDAVTLVYSAAGTGEPARVFVHGGLADRSFFDGQLRAFAGRHRVVVLDLAGHGESGTDRKKWGIPEFGGDIKAVVEAERLERVILFGNSLGGPAAVEAALLLPGRVIGVVGIDTFQDLGRPATPEDRQQQADATRKRAEAFRQDFAGSMKAMVGMLFHPDADPRVIGEAERRMLHTSPEVPPAILAGLAAYDYTQTARRLTVPLRAINGDIYPTDVAAIRKVKADFDAVIMKHMGHYPMLERPDEFNRHVAALVQALGR